MKYIIVCMSFMLTACAQPPAWLANQYDRADACQTREFSRIDGSRLKPANYQQPADLCRGKTYTTQTIRNVQGQTVGTIRSY